LASQSPADARDKYRAFHVVVLSACHWPREDLQPPLVRRQCSRGLLRSVRVLS
jgi:hypothetical protein